MSSRLAPLTSTRSTRPRCASSLTSASTSASGSFRATLDGVAADPQAQRIARGELRLQPFRHRVEGERQLVDALRKQLQLLQTAARDLPAVVHDQDLVAQLFGLAQDLCRQDDGAAALCLLAQSIHDRALQDRIHPGRELVEKHDRRIDHEHLRHLHPPLKAAAQVLRLAQRFRREAKLLHHLIGALRANRRAA